MRGREGLNFEEARMSTWFAASIKIVVFPPDELPSSAEEGIKGWC
jgi:hypothetical protein